MPSNLDRLIDYLEAMPPEEFNMAVWREGKGASGIGVPTSDPELACEILTAHRQGHTCGTAGCIAGYALAMAVAERAPEIRDHVGNGYAVDGITKAAAKYLDLPEDKARELFLPARGYVGYMEIRERIPVKDALTVLKNYRDTGEVDWTVVGVPNAS